MMRVGLKLSLPPEGVSQKLRLMEGQSKVWRGLAVLAVLGDSGGHAKYRLTPDLRYVAKSHAGGEKKNQIAEV